MFPQELDDLARMMHELGLRPEDVMKAAGDPAALEQLLNPVGSRAARQQASEPSDIVSTMAGDFEQAKARFDAEKNMPPIPFVAKPREWFLMALQAERQEVLEREKSPHISMKHTIIGTEAHVSTIALEQLERVSLRQMHIRKTHQGKYLLCRIATFPLRVFSIHIPIEDVYGDVCLLELYNYPGTIGASSELVEALFPVGSILAIREPTLKSAARGGDPILRVDCPSNVIWLEPDDKKLVGVKWKTGDHVPNSPRMPSTEEGWKKQGNGHYQNGRHIPAAVSYSRGLKRFPASSVLRLNRAMAYLQLQYYGAALWDCEAVLEHKELPNSLKSKALYRAAQALYGTGNWDEAELRFTAMAAEYPAEATGCQIWIQKCRDRRSEATEGKYNWVTAYKAAQAKPCKMDLADFTGPVKVVSLPSRGGGRGVVAKRDIKFGELLVVSKAFVSCSMDDSANPETHTIINLITNRMDKGYRAVTATKVAERIAGNPKAADAVDQLYAGPSNRLPPSEYNTAPSEKVNVARLLHFDRDVDIRRIEGVLTFNSFATPSLGPARSRSEDKIDEQLHPSSLFLLPSLFNHSCSPNAFWYCLGDVMMIRATCDIPAGNEVFLSYTRGGDSYISRAKDSCLASLLGSCNCSLCTRDRQAGEAVCKQREQLGSKINLGNTDLAIRSHIKKLDETFKDYPTSDRYAVIEAYIELQNHYKARSDYVNVLWTLFKRLEYMGLKVMDTTVRGVLSSSDRDALPIKLVTIGGSQAGSSLGQVGVNACVNIHHVFVGEFDDIARAAKWLKGAVWRKFR
ncbi:hypothetical protein M407DRAFT_73166 [Tulasnella calospora MUT 4182]|uniref:SET domain-containing protein n=1 Tax=Tulasnella calospora MUT 4182 TaxID=1051891 RepID=A0A0C3QJW3_9AGAM|nr:hypothetical protein M407DRAFT_73166 [Tulasnella calospora MUT 4182]